VNIILFISRLSGAITNKEYASEPSIFCVYPATSVKPDWQGQDIYLKNRIKTSWVSAAFQKEELFSTFRVFLRRFRDPIRVPRISNRVSRIRENYHQVPKIRENRVPRIREIGSLQIHTGYLAFSLKILSTLVVNKLRDRKVFDFH